MKSLGNSRGRLDPGIALATTLAVLGVGFVSYFGFHRVPASAFDAPIHASWLSDYARAMSEHVWLPQWAAGARGGLGEPAFGYLHPGFYWLASWLVLAGLSIHKRY